jgi:hypothetical protein
MPLVFLNTRAECRFWAGATHRETAICPCLAKAASLVSKSLAVLLFMV